MLSPQLGGSLAAMRTRSLGRVRASVLCACAAFCVEVFLYSPCKKAHLLGFWHGAVGASEESCHFLYEDSDALIRVLLEDLKQHLNPLLSHHNRKRSQQVLKISEVVREISWFSNQVQVASSAAKYTYWILSLLFHLLSATTRS